MAGMVIAMVVCSTASAGGKILLIQSYFSDYPWVNSITDGVKKGLEGSGAELEIFYMDTKRKTSGEWFAAVSEQAKKKIDQFKPDVIIPADDNAQEYVAKHYVGKKSPIIVFCGVNADPKKYGYPAGNATGVIQKPIFVESLELLLRIKPETKKISVISDDGPTSTAILAYMKTVKAPVEIVSFDQPKTFNKWKALIRKYQETVDAIAINLYQTVKATPESESLPQKAIMNWTMKNNKLPTIGFFPDAFDDGVFCGIAESGEEQGFQAAKMAVDILKGKKPSDIPILIPTKGIVTVNMATAEKLKLKVAFDVLESVNRVIE